MTLARAKRINALADFPFPASTHDIYYAGYADWIAHETLIRFDAPEQDCEATMPKILEWYEKQAHRNWTYPTVALTSEIFLPGQSTLNGYQT